MVGKFLKIFGREVGGLHQAAYILAGFTFLSQILALIRDRMLAHFFGAGIELDIYYAAFRIPDLIFVSVASIVSVSVLVPLLSKKFEKSGSGEIREFLGSLASFFILLVSLVSIVVFFLLPYIQPALFPGFEPNELASLIKFSRILLISPILLGLSNIFGGVNQTMRRFFVYALSPILYNLGIILGILFLQEKYGVQGVIYGVILGAALHLLTQLVFILRSKLLPKITSKIRYLEVIGVMASSLPRALALGSTHITLLVLIAIASTMTDGSIAVFNFSFNLQSVPLAIIGVSYSLAAFPTLSRMYSAGKQTEFLADIVSSARHIIFWSLPIISLFVVLRAQIVRVILGSGSFNWSDTRLTAAALAFFVVSVVFQSLTLLFVRAYYAARVTWVPLLVNGSSALVAILSSVVLLSLFKNSPFFVYFMESLMRVSGIPGTEVLMLPLAFAIGSIFNGLSIIYLFNHRFPFRIKFLAHGFYHSFATAVSMGAVSYLMLSVLIFFFNTETLVGIFLQGAIAGLVGVLAGYLLLRALGSQELQEIELALSRKFKRAKIIIPPEQDVVS